MRKYVFIITLITISLFVNAIGKTLTIGCKMDPNVDSVKKHIENMEINYAIGFELKLAKMLEEYLTYDSSESKMNFDEFIYKITKTSERESFLENDFVDIVISSYSITDRRENEIEFSKPYLYNPGMVFITHAKNRNKYSNDKILLSSDYSIAVINGTTNKRSLEKIEENEGYEFKIKGVENIDTALTLIRNGECTALLNDYNNLLFYHIKHKDLAIACKFMQIEDMKIDRYGMGIAKGDTLLRKKINVFLEEKKTEIKQLEDDWFRKACRDFPYNSIGTNTLSEYNIKKYLDKKIISPGRIAGILFFIFTVLFIVFVVICLIIAHKKYVETIEGKNELLEGQDRLIKNQEELKKISESKNQFLNENEILRLGIEFFETCEKEINYIGSFGFITDENKRMWREAIASCIREGKTFTRIVELPELNIIKKLVSPSELTNYCLWLLMQVIKLRDENTKYTLSQSRCAPLWGHGFITLIKDKDEMLFFTGRTRCCGHLIKDNSVVEEMYRNIHDPSGIAAKSDLLNSEMILKKYFSYDDLIPNSSQHIGDALKELESNIVNIRNAENSIREYLIEKDLITD